jgi:4'-phosphopantetheinyl transferase
LSKSTANDCSGPSVAFWLADGRNLPDSEIESFERRLSAPETARYTGFTRRERQRQYLLGRMLLRLAISRIAGLPPADVGVIERSGQQPLLALPAGASAPCFSLSHCGPWIACAVSADGALGLDIEEVDARRDVLALSGTAFHPDEHRFMLSRNDSERTAAFYRIWTIKEALFKLAPDGVAQMQLPSVVDTGGRLRLHGEGWTCSELPHPTLQISICSALPSRITRIEPVNLAE